MSMDRNGILGRPAHVGRGGPGSFRAGAEHTGVLIGDPFRTNASASEALQQCIGEAAPIRVLVACRVEFASMRWWRGHSCLRHVSEVMLMTSQQGSVVRNEPEEPV